MSMVVKNNMQAVNTLNTLNKNSSTLSKELKRVSSGMKINGADDDASGYSISEKMRVKIRGLDQANANSQNANSMMRTADGAASSTVDILRTMKEKALNAINDTNTDEDRAIMQKELEQAIAQIDDNANVTFNGMTLFDGRADHTDSIEAKFIKAMNGEWLPNALDLIKETFGLQFGGVNETYDNAIEIKFEDDQTSNALAWASMTTSPAASPKLSLTINLKYASTLDPDNPLGLSPEAANQTWNRTIAHELTHAVMFATIPAMLGRNGVQTLNDPARLPLAEGAAELVHGIDDQRQAKIEAFAGDITAEPYSGGYIMYRYLAHNYGGRTAIKNLMQAFTGDLDANAAMKKAIGITYDDLKTKIQNEYTAMGSNKDFLFNYCAIDLDNLDTGSLLGSDAGDAGDARGPEDALPVGKSAKQWYFPESNETMIRGLNVHWGDQNWNRDRGLVFQVGTKANQAINFSFHDIHAEALGLRSKDGECTSVATRAKARIALTTIDNALEKVLGQQTTIGALQMRLSYTGQNLTTASENVTAAESTLRDADMAREMTEYTKANVLMQSAQSMLAQANQNSSAVLSLLQ